MNWRVLLTQGLFWLTAEVVLNVSGLDYLADFGEYRLSQQTTLPTTAIVQPAVGSLL